MGMYSSPFVITKQVGATTIYHSSEWLLRARIIVDGSKQKQERGHNIVK